MGNFGKRRILVMGLGWKREGVIGSIHIICRIFRWGEMGLRGEVNSRL
jgi:hypothetical protein